ncbi:putative transcription factor interactor and regulator CCHC(Zn) family [Arabidopsis thaliana]
MYRGLNFSINNIRKRSWVRLRNIRVNDYTKETIKEIAACVGELLKVELDLEKSQAQDYVRVQVLFDVQNPLRNSKEVQVPIGEVVSVTFDYERVRKRCFFCQIFTHDKFDCPNRQQGSLQLPSASLKKCLPERVMVDQLINPLVGMDFNDTQADKNEKEISGGVFKQKNVVVQAPMISPSRSPKFIMLPDELKGYSQAHQSQMLQVTMG